MEITIYTYRVWDTTSDKRIIPPRMATREFIAKVHNAEINEKSAKVVDESCVNDEGQEILDQSKGR